MATLDRISNREAVIELAQGIGETSSAIYSLTDAVRRLAGAVGGVAGNKVDLAPVHDALEKAERALGESYDRAILVLKDMAGDA